MNIIPSRVNKSQLGVVASGVAIIKRIRERNALDTPEFKEPTRLEAENNRPTTVSADIDADGRRARRRFGTTPFRRPSLIDFR